MSIVSSCCDAEIILQDICLDCSEHCEEYCDECGNSGVVPENPGRVGTEWSDCECGHPYCQARAENFWSAYVR
jgi:hypothetical protein